MKKIIIVLLVFSFMGTVYALNITDSYTEIDLDYVIPEYYNDDTFIVKTENFNLLNDDSIRLNINVINNTNDVFEYKDYSFKLTPTSDIDYSKILFSFDAEYNINSIKDASIYINDNKLGNPFFKEYFGLIEDKSSLKGIRIDKEIGNYDLYLEFVLDRITYE